MRSFHRFPGYTYAALLLGILAPLLAAASDGELDPGFSGNGKAVVGFTVNATAVSAYATAMAIQPDGKIVLAGHVNPGTASTALARLDPDGTRDSGFGDGYSPILLNVLLSCTASCSSVRSS